MNGTENATFVKSDTRQGQPSAFGGSPFGASPSGCARPEQAGLPVLHEPDLPGLRAPGSVSASQPDQGVAPVASAARPAARRADWSQTGGGARVAVASIRPAVNGPSRIGGSLDYLVVDGAVPDSKGVAAAVTQNRHVLAAGPLDQHPFCFELAERHRHFCHLHPTRTAVSKWPPVSVSPFERVGGQLGHAAVTITIPS